MNSITSDEILMEDWDHQGDDGNWKFLFTEAGTMIFHEPFL